MRFQSAIDEHSLLLDQKLKELEETESQTRFVFNNLLGTASRVRK